MYNGNWRQALVNRSGTRIPVYEKLVHSDGYTGGITVGGAKIGEIYPDEFYTIIPNNVQTITSYEIIFQNPNGVQTRGYIETARLSSYPVYEWGDYQEPYHQYNSNGSSLVKAKPVKISSTDSTEYCIFTVYGSARPYRSRAGVLLGNLPVGTKLATTCSTTGQTYGGYMSFDKKKLPNGNWQDLTANGYGFVDLGLNVGSFPYNRPIR